MALSRTAAEHAAEIANHDWSDAPWRVDRAGHDRAHDTRSSPTDRVLTPDETDAVRMNAMWVTAQVLAYSDPNFDVYEFAEACGVDTKTRTGRLNGGIAAGLRRHDGRYARPGGWNFDPEPGSTKD